MENKYTEILDLLMRKRKEKKSKPTHAEQQKFYCTWLEMAAENGFDNVAESYLFYGFSFCGASAFVKFLQQSNNPQQELLKLMNGKRFAEDSNTTFRVLINTLALLLNEKAPVELTATIMKYLPKASLNKEGKPLGTAPKSFEKYFLSELNPYVELPSLCGFPEKPAIINTFCALISELLDETDKTVQTHSGKISNQVVTVRKWVKEYTTSLLEPDRINQKKEVVDKIPVPVKERSIPDPAERPEKTIAEEASAKNTGCPDTEEKLNPTDQITDLLSQIKSLTLSMSQRNTDLEAKITRMTEVLSEKDKSINILEAQLNSCNEQIEGLKKQLAASEADGLVLRQTISEKEYVIQQKDEEIAERTKMTDILSRDRARQSSEVLQKLASRIRVEYRDFSDAEDLPMTCDLGENMRLQLQNVFDILEKGGMKIK